jgi:hypothetical protein
LRRVHGSKQANDSTNQNMMPGSGKEGSLPVSCHTCPKNMDTYVHTLDTYIHCCWKGLVCNPMPDIEVDLVPLERKKEAVNNQRNTER